MGFTKVRWDLQGSAGIHEDLMAWLDNLEEMVIPDKKEILVHQENQVDRVTRAVLEVKGR